MKKGTFPKIVEPRLNKKTCSTLRKKEPRITWDTFSKLIKIQQVKITVSNGYTNFKEVSIYCGCLFNSKYWQIF